MTPEAAVLMVAPSPKSQNRLVIVPVELSVKVTLSGLRPVVGLPVKFAVGPSAPAPVTVLLLLPPLLVKTTWLLKLAALVGLKLTATKPVWPGVRLKGLPLWMAKGGAVAALPLRVGPPVLTSWKLCVLVRPITRGPKFRRAGLSANCGGVVDG